MYLLDILSCFGAYFLKEGSSNRLGISLSFLFVDLAKILHIQFGPTKEENSLFVDIVLDFSNPEVKPLEAFFFLYGVEKYDSCDSLVAALYD